MARTLLLALLLLICAPVHADDELLPLTQPKIIKQRTDSDCGQACVAMIANITIEQSYFCYGHRGVTSSDETASVLRKMGFRVRVISTRYNAERCFWGRCGIAVLSAPDGGVGHCQVWFKGKIYDPGSQVSRWPVAKFIEVLGKEP